MRYRSALGQSSAGSVDTVQQENDCRRLRIGWHLASVLPLVARQRLPLEPQRGRQRLVPLHLRPALVLPLPQLVHSVPLPPPSAP